MKLAALGNAINDFLVSSHLPYMLWEAVDGGLMPRAVSANNGDLISALEKTKTFFLQYTHFGHFLIIGYYVEDYVEEYTRLSAPSYPKTIRILSTCISALTGGVNVLWSTGLLKSVISRDTYVKLNAVGAISKICGFCAQTYMNVLRIEKEKEIINNTSLDKQEKKRARFNLYGQFVEILSGGLAGAIYFSIFTKCLSSLKGAQNLLSYTGFEEIEYKRLMKAKFSADRALFFLEQMAKPSQVTEY